MSKLGDKGIFRKKCSKLRYQLKSDERDSRIAERVVSCDKILNADVVVLYASFGSEADTWEIFDRLLKLGKVVAFPKCQAERQMTFHIVGSPDELTDGKFNIREPDGTSPAPVLTDKSICIVPGLAFTENGDRLGYGGGYYDNFLKQYPQLYTVALTYEELIFPSIPIAVCDIKIKAIATEERMVLCYER